ncbi:MAG: hypothetical protein ACREJN_16160 [Nitrospiraceae bacterium]
MTVLLLLILCILMTLIALSKSKLGLLTGLFVLVLIGLFILHRT